MSRALINRGRLSTRRLWEHELAKKREAALLTKLRRVLG